MKIFLYAIDKKTGEEIRIDQRLYWFEENGVSTFEGMGHFSNHRFRCKLISSENPNDRSLDIDCSLE